MKSAIFFVFFKLQLREDFSDFSVDDKVCTAVLRCRRKIDKDKLLSAVVID